MKKFYITIVEKKAFGVYIEAKNVANARGLAKEYCEKGNYENVEKRIQEPKIIYRHILNEN